MTIKIGIKLYFSLILSYEEFFFILITIMSRLIYSLLNLLQMV